MKRGDKITITVEIELVNDNQGGSMTMAYADCIATVRDGDQELGNVGGRMGAVYEIHDNATGETWRMTPSTFWHAFHVARSTQEISPKTPD